jgi:glycosyltransferase involved in cell wall biosynthesis
VISLDILLSIVIPSHNKTELLLAAVASILNEGAFDGRCELCISDNSLTEKTSVELEEKYSRDSRVVYRRSLDAPSLDENVSKAVEMARGQYVWIFGDDDLIVPRALQSILELLSGGKYGLLVINSQSFVGSEIIEQRRQFFSKDREYDQSQNEEFLVDMGGYLTYVCATIIKKNLWVNNFDPTFIGTVMAHLATMLNAKKESVAYFFSEPAIKMRMHSQTWTDHHFRIWNINYPSIIWGLKGFSDKAKRGVVRSDPLNSLLPILSSRAYGRYDIQVYRTCVLPATNCSLFFKLIHFCIALVPRILFCNLYRALIQLGFKKKTINFSPKLALALLKND